jgi:hypothetical protein
MLAQDTGSAIRGVVRADFFWGFGEQAATEAGRMKQQGKMWVLLPPGPHQNSVNAARAGAHEPRKGRQQTKAHNLVRFSFAGAQIPDLHAPFSAGTHLA